MEQKIRRSEVEIMAPVGSYESLMAAIQAHADSIYFGVEKLNMRAGSSANFTLDDLARIVAIAREHGIKTYLTVNTILYDQDLEEMHRVLDRALAEGINAVIASDSVCPFDRARGTHLDAAQSVEHRIGCFLRPIRRRCRSGPGIDYSTGQSNQPCDSGTRHSRTTRRAAAHRNVCSRSPLYGNLGEMLSKPARQHLLGKPR